MSATSGPLDHEKEMGGYDGRSSGEVERGEGKVGKIDDASGAKVMENGAEAT